MTNFEQFGLPAALAANLARMQYTSPTPIQEQTIPLALQGKDILGSAQTGTGKTAAFGIPLITRLMSNPRGSALVLTPTRELAVQVIGVLQKMLGTHSPIKAALLIGGESMPQQIIQLRARPRLIVGTPGRINDHLERGTLMLHDANFLVLDETDRMLDMGFGIQLEKIVKFLPQTRQTLMFSATLPQEIIKLSSKYLQQPERIAVGSTTATAVNIEQEILYTSEAGKYAVLLEQLQKRTGSIVIFVKTKRGADRLCEKLNKQEQSADTIHGDLHQRKRERVIQAFRSRKYRILVATDIAARGLDIPHIEHVINYDLPQCPEDYIHRVGRTARAGAQGAAVCLISPEDSGKWAAISRMMNPGATVARHPLAGQGSSGDGDKHSRSRRRKPFGAKGGNAHHSGNKPAHGAAGAPAGNKPARKRFRPRRTGGAPKQAA